MSPRIARGLESWPHQGSVGNARGKPDLAAERVPDAAAHHAIQVGDARRRQLVVEFGQRVDLQDRHQMRAAEATGLASKAQRLELRLQESPASPGVLVPLPATVCRLSAGIGVM